MRVARAISAALLGTLLIAAAPAQPLREGAPLPAAAWAAWGFDRSDLAPHPGVRFGVLANGMRYAVMRNAVPAGGLAARLRFGAGASVEGAGERGYMHLIEHLIFHGTPDIPEGSLPLMLGTRGLRRLTDFDAFTSHDETVYRLDLARADPPARETALTLMREIAGRLAFTRRTVAGAKAKVAQEIRGRDQVQDRIAAAQNAFFFPGTAIARGPVAGTTASVARATPAALRRLYELYYRPSRATLVLVGDFDPAAVEAEIAARFSDWQARGPAAPDPPPPSLQSRRGTEARLFVDPAAPSTVTVAAVEPLGGAADVARSRDSHFLEHLAAEMMNRRLARTAAGPEPAFRSANLAIYDHFSTARIAELRLEGNDWRRPLAAAGEELRRALQDGFTAAELEEQLESSRRSLAAASAPRSSAALADAIVDAAARDIVFTEAAGPASTAAYLARVSLADVNSAFRAAWSSPGRLIFVSHDRAVRNGEAAIAAAWREATAHRR